MSLTLRIPNLTGRWYKHTSLSISACRKGTQRLAKERTETQEGATSGFLLSEPGGGEQSASASPTKGSGVQPEAARSGDVALAQGSPG